MPKIDLLKPLSYSYRDEFEVKVFYVDCGTDPVYYGVDLDGLVLDLKTLELSKFPSNSCYTSSLENLLDQIEVFLNKQKTGILYASNT